ncbi:autotransporter domain-containing protein [Bosea sp. NPDC055353]
MLFLPKSTVAALMLTTALTSSAVAQSGGLLTDPATWRTPEYKAQWGLDDIKAAQAYARGVDGTGVSVGVIDSGIFAQHPEFIGRYGGGYDYLTETAQAIDRSNHGTGVASVIAANRDGKGMHGVAPGATLIVAGADDSQGLFIDGAFAARAYADLQARGVRIINNSYGDDRPITEFTRNSYLSEDASSVSVYRRAVAAGILSIWGTANQALDQPSAQAGLPHLFPELERGWLAVMAVGPGYIPDYTNLCGVAKTWCLGAPGGGPGWEWDASLGDFVWMGVDDGILVAKSGGGYEKTLGTSFAAPHVTGAAALVWQMFPFFSADQVRQTLLGTARDLGAPGVDDVFGYGLLDVGRAVAGPGRFDWGDFVVEQPGGIAFFENDIVGAGGLVKRGAGELVLTGHSAYAGATRVEGGFLSIMGSIASPTRVAPAGVLAGTGLIIGDVGNAGTVWAGDARGVGTLTINGNYVQQPGGVLMQQVSAAGGLNRLDVSGTASLAGQVAMGGEPELLPREMTMPVLTAGQGLIGRFDGVAGPFGDGSAPFIRATLRYQPNAAHLDIRTAPFDTPGVCASANQCAAAAGLERGLAGASSDLRGVALLLQAAGTREGARQALASLSGESLAGLGTQALGGFAPFGGMIGQRLSALRNGQAAPTSAGPAMAYASSGSPAVAMRLPAASAPANVAWLRGYGLSGRLGGDLNAGRGDYSGGGVIGGVDRQITPSFLAGFSVGFGRTETDFRNFSGKGAITAHEAALYGSYGRGNLRLDGILGYARLGFENQRSIDFGGLSRQARADYDGDRFTAALEAGYGFDLGWGTVEPLAGLRYTYLRQDGFTESGADGIGLTLGGQTAQSLLGSVGLKLAKTFDLGGSQVALEARALWQHEFLDTGMVLDAAFAGAPAATFAVRGAEMGRDSAVLGLGVSARAADKLTLFAGYDVRLNADATSHAVTAGLRASW